jgi:hypothetical protein
LERLTPEQVRPQFHGLDLGFSSTASD